MTLRAKFWWTVAAVSGIVNGGGAVFALRNGEWLHGGAHAALLALTLFLVDRFRPRAVSTDYEYVEPPATLGDVRMEQLQQSVDAIAVEVERIGEAQRYNAKVQAKQGEGSGERH